MKWKEAFWDCCCKGPLPWLGLGTYSWSNCSVMRPRVRPTRKISFPKATPPVIPLLSEIRSAFRWMKLKLAAHPQPFKKFKYRRQELQLRWHQSFTIQCELVYSLAQKWGISIDTETLRDIFDRGGKGKIVWEMVF